LGKVVLAIKILDFDLEGSHFIIEADISLRQKADDNMESHWPRYFFENTQVYKETDGVISPFPITAVTWYGCPITANHALEDVVERITRNETGKLTVREVCPELQEFLNEFNKYPASPNRQMLSRTRHLDFPERVAPTQSRWQSSPTK
jgi:hypothetical protein